ncbi:cation transporter [Terrarubrum flagellatum]|uniref:cation transporter n=1 Tax=Terrirubrum flagellatum TaxID=2895980 RepID=UPI003144F580
MTEKAEARAYTITIWAIALGILLFGAATVAVALVVGNRQLLKDGIDWIYDVVFYGLAAAVFGRGETAERLAALCLAGVMAVAGASGVYDLWDKIENPRPIDLWFLGFSAGSAIGIALLVAASLIRFRRTSNPLIKATWLSSRNDIVSTTGYAVAGFAARGAPIRWPEYALDLLGIALAFQAAWAIWRTASPEANDQQSVPGAMQ